MIKQMKSLLVWTALPMVLQGCTLPHSYVVDAPEPSTYTYVAAESQTNSKLNFIDAREVGDRTFSSGELGMETLYEKMYGTATKPWPFDMTLDGAPLEPIGFLAEFTVAELDGRGISVEAGTSDAVELRINKLFMYSYYDDTFTTVTMLSADVMAPEGTKRVIIFVPRHELVLLSFNEVIEPTLNQPLELLVQEFAAKINMILYKQSVSDSTVQELVEKVNSGASGDLTYLDVYQLGFSNNPKAIEPLVAMTKTTDEDVRMAAIASLGTLNAQDQVDYLISIIVSTAKRERVMAMKSLVDLASMGNDRARAFIDKNRRRFAENVERRTWSRLSIAWTEEIVTLYLQDEVPAQTSSLSNQN